MPSSAARPLREDGVNISGRLLDAFLALEDTRRFSLAADRCCVSASAFSQMISRLEQQVGARLFDRDTRNVTLTPEGEVFAQGAHRIAAEISNTLHELQHRAQRTKGRVSVAALPSAAADWVPRQLAIFRETSPGISLRLWDVVSERCLEMVYSGDADLGINASPGSEAEFEAKLLFQEPFYLLCPQDDLLATRSSVRLPELQGKPCVQTIRASSMWQYSQILMQRAHMRDAGFEVTQLGALSGLVANGFGLAFVPKSAIALCLREGVAAVPLSAKGVTRPIYLLRRRGRSLSIAAAAFWAQLLKSAPRIARRP